MNEGTKHSIDLIGPFGGDYHKAAIWWIRDTEYKDNTKIKISVYTDDGAFVRGWIKVKSQP